jgi:predicted DsbA family dithiol-disulfide isomerase
MTLPTPHSSALETPAKLDVEVFSDFICPWCYIGHRRLMLARHALGEELDAGTVEAGAPRRRRVSL